MPQPLVYLLLSLVLILPVVGAVVLRVLQPRLDARAYYALAVAIFGIAAASTIALAGANITTLRVAGLTVLQPDSGQAELPDAIGVPLEPPPDTTLTPAPTVSATPTVTRVPTVTRAPTRTPTPAPTATPTTTPTATPETPTATPAPVGPRRYTIEAGDTLRDIAERFGVSVQAILDANRLTPAQADSLRPGQEIIIP